MKIEIAKVMAKGQITIPKDIRDELNINIGDKLVFEANEGNLIVKKTNYEIKNIEKQYILKEDIALLENSKQIYTNRGDEQINNSIITMYYVLMAYLDYHKITTSEFMVLDDKYKISKFVYDNYYLFDNLPENEMVNEVDKYVRSNKN